MSTSGLASPGRAFAVQCAAVGALLAAWSIARHHAFHSTVYDLGIFHQLLWNTSRGRWFESSLKRMSYLGDHFSPSLALLAPLEWLPFAVEWLLVAQAAAAAWTAWNLWRLALTRTGDARTAWIVGLATLLHPALFCPTLFDVHPEIFMAAVLSRALCDLERDALGRASLWLAIFLGGKEDAGLLLGPLGLVVAAHPGPRARRLFGLGLGAIGFAWSVLAMAVFMPAFRPPQPPDAKWFYLARYAHLGATVGEIVRSALLHPLRSIAASIDAWKAVTLVVLLAGYGLAPFRGGARLLAVAPLAGAHFLSSRWTQFHFSFQYLAPLVPVIAWAAAHGAPSTVARRPRLALALAALAGLFAVGSRVAMLQFIPRAHSSSLRRAIALVPGGAPVCVFNRFGAHLAARRELDLCVRWSFEEQQYRYFGWPEVSTATWQVFDRDESDQFPLLPSRLDALRRAGAEVLFDREGVTLLRVAPEVAARATRR